MSATAARRGIHSPVARGILALFACLAALANARADLIRLKSGGEVRGKIVKSRTNRDSITLETLSGAVVTVAKTDLQFATMRPLSVEEYESRLRRIPETVEAHWELADWCRQKALVNQRETHLRTVLRLDAEHEAAHRALGHIRQKGGWVDRDELMTSQGYVKYKGKYITAQEFELAGKTEVERQAEREWFQKVKLWSGWVQGSRFSDAGKPQEGWKSLDQIRDPDATPAVMRFLGESEHRELRGLAVKILSQSASEKPVASLVQLSLKDEDPAIRRSALDGLSEERHAAAMPLYLKFLKHDLNPVVCRAGWALEVVGNEKSVPSLIDALITPHNYQVRVPGSGQPNFSFSTNGGFAGAPSLPPQIEAGLRTGRYPNGVIVLDGIPGAGTELAKTRIITVTVEQQNVEVLGALQKLTGQDFGYDERTWRLWWAAEKNQGVKTLLKS